MATVNINQMALYIKNNGATVKQAEKQFNVELDQHQKELLNRQLKNQKEAEQSEQETQQQEGGTNDEKRSK